ncbi:MAG: hypothetical protein RI565_09785 [Schleiferiaceae bacterium]|nr:hypothetical protein [Schleiferiaceae bacterium]
MAKEENREDWPDLAIGLYDKLTGRNAKITYDFDSFKLGIPRKVGSTERAEWEMNGKLTISTSESS